MRFQQTRVFVSVNTKHLYNICTMLDQRRRRWADVLQMLYKSFVFAGRPYLHEYCFDTQIIFLYCDTWQAYIGIL